MFEDRKYAIIGHMSDLYRDYRHKMKSKYFDSKASYQLRLQNKLKRVSANENIWLIFGVMLIFRYDVLDLKNCFIGEMVLFYQLKKLLFIIFIKNNSEENYAKQIK